MTNEEKPHYLGHRKRVKEKFLKNDINSFADYELLEILLFSTQARKDTKILAKKIIENFGNIENLVNSELNLLAENPNINKNTLVLLKIIKEIINRNFLQKISKKSIIQNWNSILDYCKIKLSHLKTEEFRILFLDKKQQLIEDYQHNEGLIDNVQIDVEKIVRKAVLLSAASAILVHNHPTNCTKPSKNDILTTEKIIKSFKVINIKIHDHLIIGADNYYSFKENGLI